MQSPWPESLTLRRRRIVSMPTPQRSSAALDGSGTAVAVNCVPRVLNPALPANALCSKLVIPRAGANVVVSPVDVPGSELPISTTLCVTRITFCDITILHGIIVDRPEEIEISYVVWPVGAKSILGNIEPIAWFQRLLELFAACPQIELMKKACLRPARKRSAKREQSRSPR